MNKIILIAGFLFLTAAVSNGQDTTSVQSYPDGQTFAKERIKASDLPQTITRQLEGEGYRGWLVSAVYKGKMKDPTERSGNTQDKQIYLLDLKKGHYTITAIFDENGKRLDQLKKPDY